MTRSAQPPKVSVIVLTYRQENYIDSALGSILGQEGPPVEIVVGDDASPDGTAARIRQIIADYRGPHSVRLLAHPRNLGLLGNFNRCVAACTGDIVVAAAGDDLSHPRRCLRMAEIFASHPELDIVVSNGRRMDTDGNPLEARMFSDLSHREGRDPRAKLTHIYQRLPVVGAFYAYRRSLLTDFGPLIPGSYPEDQALGFRSFLRGGYLYLPDVLVDYRVHASSLSFGLFKKDADPRAELRRQSLAFRRTRGLRRQHLADLHHAREAGLISPKEFGYLHRRVEFAFRERRLRFHAHAARLGWGPLAGLLRSLAQISPGRAFAKIRPYGQIYLRTRAKLSPGRLSPSGS